MYTRTVCYNMRVRCKSSNNTLPSNTKILSQTILLFCSLFPLIYFARITPFYGKRKKKEICFSKPKTFTNFLTFLFSSALPQYLQNSFPKHTFFVRDFFGKKKTNFSFEISQKLFAKHHQNDQKTSKFYIF